jgi:hypothetical protein
MTAIFLVIGGLRCNEFRGDTGIDPVYKLHGKGRLVLHSSAVPCSIEMAKRGSSCCLNQSLRIFGEGRVLVTAPSVSNSTSCENCP